MNALNFIASEIHIAVGTNWFNTKTKEQKDFAQMMFDKKMTWLDNQLAKRKTKFYVTDRFSVVDAYLCVCLSWIHIPIVNQTFDKYDNIEQYVKFVTSQPNWIAAQQRMEMNPETIC